MKELPLFGPSAGLPPMLGGTSIGEAPGMQVLAPATGFMDDFDFTLNQYSGCAFGCSYCYAAFFVHDQWKRENWGKWVEVKVSALEQLARKRSLQGKKIYMSSVTDPYQPIELKLELTREILQLLSEPSRQPRLVIQTRSPFVVRDVDLLKRFEHLRVNFTITTDDDSVRKRFEPGCPSNERRIQAAEECIRAGIKVGISVAPMLPLKDTVAFAQRLHNLGADRYMTQPFKASRIPFAASTRKMAMEIASDYGWTMDRANDAIQQLRRVIPETFIGKEGFGPV
jgi:DNA repair photolyase